MNFQSLITLQKAMAGKKMLSYFWFAAVNFVGVVYCDVLNAHCVEQLINKTIKRSLDYKFPKDNRGYLTSETDNTSYYYGEFDFIIVGAGSSGSVLASRLSELPNWKILLLEAGGALKAANEIPGLYYNTLYSDDNWGYKTVPQKNGCYANRNRMCDYPRGKILGGSSSINGLIYARGNREDYQRWYNLGNPGWNYDEVLPYFKKLENFHIFEKEYRMHGHDGPLDVNYTEPTSPLQEVFNQAHLNLGLDNVDYNGMKQLGVSQIQHNVKHGRRICGANAYIEHAKDRSNLNVTTDALVTRILVKQDSGRAYGVNFIKNGKYYYSFATKEVIMSAGNVNTPQLLMLSGIGPKDELQKHNIELIADLPVGENLKDHLAIDLTFKSSYSANKTNLHEQTQEFVKGRGVLTTPFNGKSISFLPNRYNRIAPFAAFVLRPPPGMKLEGPIPPYNPDLLMTYFSKISPITSFSLVVILLHPKSSGKIKLQSNSPFDFPLIDPGVLTSEEDIRDLYEAINLALNLTRTKPFVALKPKLFPRLLPCMRYHYTSAKYWRCVIQYLALPAYHGVGTASMGPNPEKFVVDSELKVHSVSGLRVADCSVIPVTLSGHINGPAFMVGEKASDLIKKDYKAFF